MSDRTQINLVGLGLLLLGLAFEIMVMRNRLRLDALERRVKGVEWTLYWKDISNSTPSTPKGFTNFVVTNIQLTITQDATGNRTVVFPKKP